MTGLLTAEVNVKTMCELGSGGVSLVILLSSFWLKHVIFVQVTLDNNIFFLKMSS